MQRALSKIRHYHSALGWKGVIAFCFAKLFRAKLVLTARIEGIKYPVYVRIPTTDVSVLRQVLIERHYEFTLDPLPRTVIDAGANIGLSAVYFANRFPGAKIVAIEPEESNYKLLIRNIANYPNITPIRAALWKSNGVVSLVDPGAGSHGFQTAEKASDSGNQGDLVPATTVEQLMSHFGWSSVDLLKVDIEGSEKQVFECSRGWIDQVQVVMAELHDHLQDGCTTAFEAATSGFQGQASRGETIMVSNHVLTPLSSPDSKKDTYCDRNTVRN